MTDLLLSMAPLSPRRSSRGRFPQQSQDSSANSSTSGRLERSTRSLNHNSTANKATSSSKSTPSLSLSSEPFDEYAVVEESLATRRSKRGQENAGANAASNHGDRHRPTARLRGGDDDDDPDDEEDDDNDDKMALDEEDDDEDIIREEDEAVRCVCGFDDYPGPLPSTEDVGNHGHGTAGSHSRGDASSSSGAPPVEVMDEASTLFVQCDTCKVWQHGPCVGIFRADTTPEDYYCEQCHKEFHKIHTASNG